MIALRRLLRLLLAIMNQSIMQFLAVFKLLKFRINTTLYEPKPNQGMPTCHVAGLVTNAQKNKQGTAKPLPSGAEDKDSSVLTVSMQMSVQKVQNKAGPNVKSAMSG